MQMQTAPTADAVTTVLAQVCRELESLPSARRLTDADTGAVYSLAYREYGQGRYEEALRYFQLLLVYRPTSPVYMLGGALCLQRLRRYELACSAFAALCCLEPEVPGHTLALAECQLLCNQHAQARDALQMVVYHCDTHPGHDRVRARAHAMLELMRPHHDPDQA